MEQMHLVVYLEYHGCKEVRHDKNGYYVMKNYDNDKISGIPLPTSADKKLKHTTICTICKTLDVPLPPTTPGELLILLKRIDKDVQKRIAEKQIYTTP